MVWSFMSHSWRWGHSEAVILSRVSMATTGTHFTDVNNQTNKSQKDEDRKTMSGEEWVGKSEWQTIKLNIEKQKIHFVGDKS